MGTSAISQERINQSALEETSGTDNEVLHLKRLLVTLKQRYEKTLSEFQKKLEAETALKSTYQVELEKTRIELHQYEDEQVSLKQQQITLKDLLKNQQEELKYLKSHPHMEENEQDANTRYQLELERQKTAALQKELNDCHDSYKQQIADLQHSISIYEEEKSHLDHLPRLSEQMRYEMDLIKKTLIQGVQENKSLESRYVELFNEKLHFEQQVVELNNKLNDQSSHFDSFKSMFEELEEQKKQLENHLNEKYAALEESQDYVHRLENQLEHWREHIDEKNLLQDKYDQLRDEWEKSGKQLEEVLDARTWAETELVRNRSLVEEIEKVLNEQHFQLENLSKERESLLDQVERYRHLYEDCESRLKVSQQHLAKKVKETAILNEKISEQQGLVGEQIQQIESARAQVSHLQSSVDLYQKQEMKLQEQVHDALKATENQVAKWEEKYFKMYDKWQESENQIRELRKFEEKYHQMQSLLANLGIFMGNSINNPAHINPLYEAARIINSDIPSPTMVNHPSDSEEKNQPTA